MEKKEKALLFLKDLDSSDSKEIGKTLDKIKETGNVHYIPYLIEKINLTTNTEIKKQILTFLHSVKDKKATEFYIEAIKNDNNKAILKDLLQFCWESGFDLSSYGDIFLEILIKEDYEIAIEAFSAVEENLMDFSDEQKANHILYLKENLSLTDDIKKPLIVELVNLLEK